MSINFKNITEESLAKMREVFPLPKGIVFDPEKGYQRGTASTAELLELADFLSQMEDAPKPYYWVDDDGSEYYEESIYDILNAEAVWILFNSEF